MSNKRSNQRIKQNLGIIGIEGVGPVRQYRSKRLHNLCLYYENKQHDNKMDWFEADRVPSGQFISIRERKPYIIYPLPRIHSARVAAKLFGEKIFPLVFIEDDTKIQHFIRAVLEKASFAGLIHQMSKEILAYGSGLIRFYYRDGNLMLESYKSNHCFPLFNDVGEMKEVMVRYTYFDEQDYDNFTKEPKKKWFKLELKLNEDILYDNPEFKDGVTPNFKVKERFPHNNGSVQGEWFKVTRDMREVDGASLIEDIIDLGDSISYNLCQSDRAAEYGTDPQTVFTGLDANELDEIVKSRERAWALGRDGQANFLEQSGSGLKTAGEIELRLVRKAQEITRVIMHDPEKIVGSAQSAKAMEVLNGPLVEFIKEIRPIFEKHLKSLITKIAIVSSKFVSTGNDIGIDTKIPRVGLLDSSLSITLNWGEIFPPTIQDLQQKVSFMLQLVQGNLLSRETALEKIAFDLGIKDTEEELKRIKAQPPDPNNSYM